MTVHEKTGSGIAGPATGKHRAAYAVEMTVRVVVPAVSPQDALEQVTNTANWTSWQWVGQRVAGEDE